MEHWLKTKYYNGSTKSCRSDNLSHLVSISTIELRSVRTGFRTGQAGQAGQAGQLPRGLHNQGTSTYVVSPFIFLYSRVGCASTPEGCPGASTCLSPALRSAPSNSKTCNTVGFLQDTIYVMQTEIRRLAFYS